MHRRRLLIRLLGAAAALAAYPAARSQHPARSFTLGVLFAGTLARSERYFAAFFESLAQLGYAEGKNLRVERRFADGRIDRLDALAAELVGAKVDIVFAPPTPAVLALKKASTEIPIVFCVAPDPIGTGLA